MRDFRVGSRWLARWQGCLLVSGAATVLTYWPGGADRWHFDSELVAAGQWWRLLTGHLVHLNAWHLGLNLLGLWLIVTLLWNDTSRRRGLAASVFCMLAIDAVLWRTNPAGVWYAGLSGLLHGLWAFLAAHAIMTSRPSAAHADVGVHPVLSTRPGSTNVRVAGIVGTGLLVLKLIVEYRSGPSVLTTELIGPVMPESHRVGAFAGWGFFTLGLLVGILASMRQRRDNFD